MLLRAHRFVFSNEVASLQQQIGSGPVLRLASASPRRRQLLELIGVPHVVTPADIDETPLPDEPAARYVCRLAQGKASAVRGSHAGLPVLAADTTVHVDGKILEKPRDEADCIRMLGLLSGSGTSHYSYSRESETFPTRHRVPFSTFEVIVPMLCATEKFYLGSIRRSEELQLPLRQL